MASHIIFRSAIFRRYLVIWVTLAIIVSTLSVGGCVNSNPPTDVITIAVNGGGTTDPPVGVYSYDTETSITLSAKAANGYRFVGWTGSVASVKDQISPNIDIQVAGNTNIYANFVPDEPTLYFFRNQQWIEGFYQNPEEIDLEEIETVFQHVFSRLPDQVTVYPSENYYYFGFHVNGRQFWGNIRLATGYRDLGELSFAYFEFNDYASPGEDKFTRAVIFTPEDGVGIEKIDRFTYEVSYEGRNITFNLHQLSQDPPNLFKLRENEVFVERTFDESGYQFFLLFNEKDNYFFWVLNEEEGVPDTLDPVADHDDITVGRRSGFAFWDDGFGRKVLASIRQHSVTRNDYYDGPFDQLADNYAVEVDIQGYMIKTSPSMEGRINEYGYFIFDQYGNKVERPLRVAISTYQTYYTESQFIQFIEWAKADSDPYMYISRRGVPKIEEIESEE